MKKNQEPKMKDVYRLWWEYLKRSEKYKINCEIILETANRNLDEWEKLYGDRTNFVPRKGIKRSKKEQLEDEWWPLYRTWETFGDVFHDSFEEWWEKSAKEFRKNVLDLEDRQSYYSSPYFMMWNCMSVEPEPEDTLADFIHHRLTKDLNYVVVAVPITGDLTMKEISQQISKIREKGKRTKLPRVHNLFIRYTEPIGRVRYDELKRYLQVYDLKQQKMSIKEIIKKIWPGKNDRDDYVRRQVYSDIKKAEKVIENVEQGYFPSKRVPSDK